MADRTLTVKIIGDEKDLLRSFHRSDAAARGFQTRLSGTSAALKTFARSSAIALTAAAGGLAVLGVRGVRAASDLNEEINKSNVLFGQSAAEVQAWSRTTATSLGLSRRASLQAAGQFAAMFSTLQLGDDVSSDMSRRLVKLGADLASFSNQDPEDMLLRLRSGLAGEAEPLRRFGILLSEARVKQEAYRLGIARVGDELTEQQKVQARYSLILRDAGKANDDFARTSDSLANAQRIARAQLENLSASIGSALLPIAARALTAFNNFLPTLSAAFSQISEAVGPGIQRFVDAFASRLPEIQRIAGSVLDPLREHVLPVLRDVAQLVAAFWGRMVSVFASNSGNISTILSNLGAVLRNVWTLARPTIVFLFEKVLPTAMRITIPLIAKVSGAFRIMSEVVTQVVSVILKAIDKFLGGLTVLTDAASKLPFVGDKFRGISDAINDSREDLRGFASELDALDGKRVDVSVVTTRIVVDGPGGKKGRGTRITAVPVTGESAASSADASLRQEDQDNRRLTSTASKAESSGKAATTAVERQRTQFEKLMDALSLRRDRAGVTQRLNDDIAVLRLEERALREQIRVEGRTTELARRLFDVRQERIDLQQRQRQGRQFQALGLTAEGQERIPSARALRRRLGTLRDQVKGTFLDTADTRSQLQRIARVLSGAFGAVGSQVREAIQRMLADISSALGGGRSGGPLTVNTGLRTAQVLKGLGLSEEQIRELRGRLSNVTTTRSTRRTIPQAPAAAAAGFGGVLGQIIVESHTRVDLDGQQIANVVTRNQQKTRRRNPRQKRGPNRAR